MNKKPQGDYILELEGKNWSATIVVDLESLPCHLKTGDVEVTLRKVKK